MVVYNLGDLHLAVLTVGIGGILMGEDLPWLTPWMDTIWTVYLISMKQLPCPGRLRAAYQTTWSSTQVLHSLNFRKPVLELIRLTTCLPGFLKKPEKTFGYVSRSSQRNSSTLWGWSQHPTNYLRCIEKTVNLQTKTTLQGTNISHLGKKENRLQKCLGREYVFPRRVYRYTYHCWLDRFLNIPTNICTTPEN